MKITLTVLFFAINCLVLGQDNNAQFSFEFAKTDLETAITTIEKQTNYTFFYDKQWINSNKITVNTSIKNQTIERVLNIIFEETDLNFYIDKNRIILTKNNVIRDQLDDDYFNDKTKTANQANANSDDKPLYFKTIDSSSIDSKIFDKLLIIGKERKKLNRKTLLLSGYLTDSKTGMPLSDANLKINNSKIITTTNKDGFYKIDIPSGLNYIEIESLNYNKIIKKIILYSDGFLDIKLDEKVNVLAEVLINVKKREDLKAAISGVTTIDIEKIKNIPLVLGERDIFKVATLLPGVKQTGEGSAGFNVRGGKEDQNLILLDNGLIYNPAHFFGFFSSVNPFTTKSATIYKGSIPSEFGGRLSSVFDITSKNGSLTKFSGEGGIGPVTSNLTLSTPIIKNKSSLMIGVRGTYSGWILRSLKNKDLRNSQASFYDVLLKYNYKINEKNNLESTIYFSNDAFSITSDSVFKYSNRLLSLNWNHIYNKKLKSELIFTNSEYKFNINYDSPYDLKNFDLGYKINESQGIIKFNHALNKKHKFIYGLSTKLYNINPGFFNPTNSQSTLVPIAVAQEKAAESALFFSDNFKISEKLLIDFGIRYSSFSALGPSYQRIYQANVPLNQGTLLDVKSYSNNQIIKTYGGFEPRFSARYFLQDNFSVKASYDRTYQYIHLLSSNTTQAPTDSWKLSDTNVKPQTAQQFSLGLYKNFPDQDVEVSVESYYKTSDNFLDFKVAAQLLLNENIETQLLQGQGKAYGLEFLVKKNSGRMNGWIGYTYSRTFIKLDSPFNDEKVNNGNYFPANFDKPHELSVVLNYKFTKRYSFSSNFIYQTGRPITYPIGKYTLGNAQYVLYSDRNQFRIPDYFRLDIGFNVEGNHKIKKLAHGFWNFSIYNVLGRNNPFSVYFVTENGQVKAYQTSIFAIPIPTLTYNFKF